MLAWLGCGDYSLFTASPSWTAHHLLSEASVITFFIDTTTRGVPDWRSRGSSSDREPRHMLMSPLSFNWGHVVYTDVGKTLALILSRPSGTTEMVDAIIPSAQRHTFWAWPSPPWGTGRGIFGTTWCGHLIVLPDKRDLQALLLWSGNV